jgi:glycosyltransferase involved in cell wall biosynthesis
LAVVTPPAPAPTFAILCPNFHPRTCGIGDNSLRFAREFVRAGHSVEIISRAPATRHPEAPEIPVHAPDESTWPMAIAAQVRRIVAARRFSHVIIQYTAQMWGAGRFGSAALPWLARSLRHDGVDVTLVAHELFTPFLPRPDLIVGAALHRAQIAAVARYAHRTFVTTDTRVEELMPFWRAIGRPGRPGVVRIGSCVDAVVRVRRPGRKRLGMFSTLATTKRFDVALGAFEHMWRRYPDSELVLIGDIGPRSDARVAAILDAVDKHPGREKIRVTGRLSLAGLAAEMAQLDLCLFPMTTGANTRSSTLPLALETGLPVVATRDKETDLHLFQDGRNILIAPAMTAEAFGQAALRVFDDPALEARLCAGARQLYEEHLAWPLLSRQLLTAILGSPAERAQDRQSA